MPIQPQGFPVQFNSDSSPTKSSGFEGSKDSEVSAELRFWKSWQIDFGWLKQKMSNLECIYRHRVYGPWRCSRKLDEIGEYKHKHEYKKYKYKCK